MHWKLPVLALAVKKQTRFVLVRFYHISLLKSIEQIGEQKTIFESLGLRMSGNP